MNCQTGVGFFDHMLDQLAKHSMIDLTVRATGDLHIDRSPHGRGCGHRTWAGAGAGFWATNAVFGAKRRMPLGDG